MLEAILAYLDITPHYFGRILISILLIFLVMFIATVLIRTFIKRLELRLKNKGHRDASSHLSLLRYILLGLVYFFSLTAVVDQIPALSKFAAAVLGGSGIAALVIGVATQDSINNLASGMMIRLFKPFQIGDVIRYLDRDVTGTVDEITLRHTVIRTFENKRLIVPNGVINSQVIENASGTDQAICTFLDIGVSYDADVARAMEIIAHEVAAHPDYLDRRNEADKAQGKPVVLVRVLNLADFSVVLRAAVWGRDGAVSAQMKSDLLLRIKNAFEAQGIAIARLDRFLFPPQ